MIGGEAEARAFVSARCDAAALERIERFIAALREENTRQNLVARATLDTVWQRHIADSAQLLDHVSRGTKPWLDLGSGAGLPGLIVAAMRPDWPIVLVESRRKRIEWLERMVDALSLAHCRVEGARLESIDTFTAAVISARAFAPLERIIRLSARFSTGNTIWLLPKGQSAAQELQDLPKRQRALFHVEQSQTDPGSGIIVGRLAGKAGS
ncbi:16S rRNA (guanine(527)-N(7))-methyltransferase RsmG [Pelagerythrobacter marensis]|uniref:Ribosomal RNA small subunit methyltransferase G n=1 Tax=Pelagerythrobacter marensis TaxID=543877 RepID=A0ABZ2D7Y8_9SPHN